MKLPYGYVLIGEETVVHEEKADVGRNIFEYYLAGAGLGKMQSIANGFQCFITCS